MTDMSIPKAISEVTSAQKPAYVPPSLRILSEDQVLEAFQITGTEISAAGCWWTGC